MKFYKYCGTGNDFVLLENFDGALTDYPALAKRLCDRHFSVGADGLIVLEPAQHGTDCRMRFYNNDGSAAEMCGNGVRCLCRHCYERGLSGVVVAVLLILVAVLAVSLLWEQLSTWLQEFWEKIVGKTAVIN